MDKATIADVLEKIATLLELKDENPFKIRAYTNAARSLETWGGNVADLGNEETLEKIPGIGKAIAAKIKELVETGSLKFFDDLRAEFPADILELFTVPGLGAKKIKALHEKLQVSSIAQLHEACVAGRVAELPGFGKTTQEKLCKSIDERQRFAGSFQLGQIAAEAEMLQSDLRAHPEALHVCIAGSYRRRKEIVRDLDFIVATSAPAEISAVFIGHPLVESIIAQGPTKSSVRLRSGIQCDLRVVSSAEYPFALNYFTGSKEHNIVMRNRALQRGWTLNEYRLGAVGSNAGSARGADRTSQRDVPTIHEEADLYRALELDYIPPELRENCGEFEAAAAGNLPRLIEAENLRGTFHCHTTASDGHNTLEEMAASPSTAAALSRPMASMPRAWACRWPEFVSSIRNSKTSGSSPASSATSFATVPSIFPTMSWLNSITSSPRSIPPLRCRRRT
jgi:DNA polymerase (family X)